MVATGEFYLVRAGNTRKGTGTFYTRPQLAVPTVHRTLEPLCYDKAADGTLTPKTAGDDPGAQGLRPGVRQCVVPGRRTALPDRRPLQVALPPPPPGRPRASQEAHAALRSAAHRQDRARNWSRSRRTTRSEATRFAERIKALLRRHVVERCIYGVDINPLAVELARVSLWVETLDPELPFSFLDHKIKVGNSLVGCWLDRVEDYPLKAWEREGGDGKDGPRTERIETFLKGEKVGNRRSGDGIIKKQMIDVIRNGFSNVPLLFPEIKITTPQVVDQLRSEYERLHDLPPDIDPEVREAYYRDHIVANPARQRLKAAMDEWCAVWFWPTDEDALRHVSDAAQLPRVGPREGCPCREVWRPTSSSSTGNWSSPMSSRPSGAASMQLIGNPPWDVMKPNSQEFFTEFDPLYRTYDKQAALRRQRELFQTVAWCHRSLGRIQRPVQGPRQLGQERRRSFRSVPGTGQGRRDPSAAVG